MRIGMGFSGVNHTRSCALYHTCYKYENELFLLTHFMLSQQPRKIFQQFKSRLECHLIYAFQTERGMLLKTNKRQDHRLHNQNMTEMNQAICFSIKLFDSVACFKYFLPSRFLFLLLRHSLGIEESIFFASQANKFSIIKISCGFYLPVFIFVQISSSP